MPEAATRPGQDTDRAADAVLDVLNFAWGGAYQTGGGGDYWWARRRDGLGGIIEAFDAESLNQQIADDFITCAVR